MAQESVFVEVAHRPLEQQLQGQPLVVKLGAALLCQVTVDNDLRVMSEARIRDPRRGDSAFQRSSHCVTTRAKAEGVSHNTLVLTFIAQGLGSTNTKPRARCSLNSSLSLGQQDRAAGEGLAKLGVS